MAAQLHFGTNDSVTFGTTGSSVGAVASFSKSLLANMQVGDLLVAWIHSQNGGTTGTITPPAGWTHYGAAIGSPTSNDSRNTGFFYYPIRSQSDITSLASTLTWTFSATGGRIGCVAARATGIDLDSIEDSAAMAFSSAANATTFNVAGITTVNATTLLVGGYFHQNSISTFSPNTTDFMTAFQEYKTNPDATVANTGSVLGYQYLTNAGATGAVTATVDNTATAFGGELVAFKAGPWTPTFTGPAIVNVATTYTSVSAVTSFDINKPSGLQDGDALILVLSAQTQTATSDFASNGWSRISQPFVASSSSTRVIAFYALPVPSAAAVTQTSFTFTSTDSATGGRIAAEMFIVRGAELSNLTSGISPYGSTAGQIITVQPDSPQVDNDLLLVAYNAQFTSNIDYTIGTGPGGMTQQASLITSTIASQSKTTLAVYQQNVNSGVMPAESLTWNGAQSQTSGVSISIRAIGAFDPNAGVAIDYTNATDSLAPARLFYTSATDTLATPAEVRPFPNGYPSVSTMLATNPFYVAHRGGSADWPEMSLYAYTQAGFWGVGALELSLARTSDGVWFGLHDASLDRTSLNTGGGSGTTLVASSMTWAQVQTHQISFPNVGNPASLPQPYMRWEELMDAYYGTHVIFVDPKAAGTFGNELLDMMDAMPGTPTDRFIGKSYGITGNVGNTTGWPHDSAARGYKNWGYFYQADAASFATYQGRYDVLGMDYTADAPTWSSIMAYGKPVIGHIIPDAAGATTAFGFGAVGLMVSGVQSAIPRST